VNIDIVGDYLRHKFLSSNPLIRLCDRTFFRLLMRCTVFRLFDCVASIYHDQIARHDSPSNGACHICRLPKYLPVGKKLPMWSKTHYIEASAEDCLAFGIGLSMHVHQVKWRRRMIRKLTGMLLTVLAVASLSIQASAQSDIIESMVSGCETELVTYCNNVTPGDKRVLACMYAHQDKLSRQCEFALYDGMAQLERAVSALRYAAGECAADMESLCSDVAQGEGRVLQCLNDNADKLSAVCDQAMTDVGLKE
jgi:hypothetical protein